MPIQFVFDDPVIFFDKYTESDFYARQEAGTEKGIKQFSFGNIKFEPLIYHDRLGEILSKFKLS